MRHGLAAHRHFYSSVSDGKSVTHPLAAGQAAFVVLAGEAFGGSEVKGRGAAIAAVGVVVIRP